MFVIPGQMYYYFPKEKKKKRKHLKLRNTSNGSGRKN